MHDQDLDLAIAAITRELMTDAHMQAQLSPLDELEKLLQRNMPSEEAIRRIESQGTKRVGDYGDEIVIGIFSFILFEAIKHVLGKYVDEATSPYVEHLAKKTRDRLNWLYDQIRMLNASDFQSLIDDLAARLSEMKLPPPLIDRIKTSAADLMRRNRD